MIHWGLRKYTLCFRTTHDDVIKWKHFPRYWRFVRGIQRSTVYSPHKGQWRIALMFSLICVSTNCWANNRNAGELRRHRVHYHVILIISKQIKRQQYRYTTIFLYLIPFNCLCAASYFAEFMFMYSMHHYYICALLLLFEYVVRLFTTHKLSHWYGILFVYIQPVLLRYCRCIYCAFT